MVTHMKTTIDIADPLLDAAKAAAARDGVTLRTLVEQGLRHALQARAPQTAAFKLRRASFKGQGLQAASQGLGWDALREISYDDRAHGSDFEGR